MSVTGQFPLHDLFVEITNRCRLNCTHCSSEAGPASDREIPAPALHQLVEDAIPLGLRRFTVSGGEPFLHSGIKDLLAHLRSKGISTCVYTSGVVGPEDSPFSDGLTAFLREQTIDRLIFSLHGSKSCIHEGVTRVRGSFRLTLQSIEKARRAGLPFEIHTVLLKTTLADLPNLVRLAGGLGASQVSVLRLVRQGRAKRMADGSLPDAGLTSRVASLARQINQECGDVRIRLGAPFNCLAGINGAPCHAGQNKLLISASGEVFPCEAFKHLRGTRQTIFIRPLQALWCDDELLDKLRYSSPDSIENCALCPSLPVCRGGCPGQRMLAYGDILTGPEPLCSFFTSRPETTVAPIRHPGGKVL